jgi:molybdate/tungstate transport system substrate-binding protein
MFTWRYRWPNISEAAMSKLRTLLIACAALGLGAAQARADTITVAYAGSMGVVMDKGIGPAFTAKTGITFHGIGQAALGLSHLIAAKSINPDVFVSVSPAPIKVVETAGLATSAAPVASTQIVLAYSPASQYAPQFAKAQGVDLFNILKTPGLRFGRTDPNTDPQGQYVLYTLQLAGKLYNQPDLEQKVAGDSDNNAEIFAEPSLLARLQEGQIDATLGYESAVISQKLPYVTLPKDVNFSDPKLAKAYAKASLTVTAKGVTKTVHPGLLVFYATSLANAQNPTAAAAFVKFLQSPEAQKILLQYGYNAGVGPKI